MINYQGKIDSYYVEPLTTVVGANLGVVSQPILSGLNNSIGSSVSSLYDYSSNNSNSKNVSVSGTIPSAVSAGS